MTGKTPAAGFKHAVFAMIENKRRVKEAERENKKTGLRKACKVQNEQKLFRGRYEVYCSQEACAE